MFQETKSIFLKITLIAIFGISINFYYGSIGVFPVDTFAHYDLANGITHNHLPFRDYWVMSGPIIDLIQALIFNLFGTSWTSYLMHSSIVNALFAVSTFLFLIKLGLNTNSSFFYSICLSILSYPTVGTPFPDHHSSIFSMISIYLLIISIKYRYKTSWYLVPLLFFIAFFSKQTPAAYFIIFSSIILLFYSIQNKYYDWFVPVISSSIFLFIFLLLCLKLNNIEISDLLIQYFYFPQSIGSERISNYDITFKGVVSHFKIIYVSLLLLLICFTINYRKLNNKISNNNLIFILFIIFSIFSLIFHQLITKNQTYIFFTIPIICGFAQSHLGNKKSSVIYFLILLTILSTYKYHVRFNVEKKFMELSNVDLKNTVKAKKIDESLNRLEWITPDYSSNSSREISLIKSSLSHIKNEKRNSIVITYYQFFSSVIKKNTFSLNRWYTSDGVSYPLQFNKYHEYYKNFFITNLNDRKIKIIYTISPLNLNDFNFVFNKKCVESKKINEILTEHQIAKC